MRKTAYQEKSRLPQYRALWLLEPNGNRPGREPITRTALWARRTVGSYLHRNNPALYVNSIRTIRNRSMFATRTGPVRWLLMRRAGCWPFRERAPIQAEVMLLVRSQRRLPSY